VSVRTGCQQLSRNGSPQATHDKVPLFRLLPFAANRFSRLDSDTSAAGHSAERRASGGTLRDRIIRRAIVRGACSYATVGADDRKERQSATNRERIPPNFFSARSRCVLIHWIELLL